MKKSDLVAKVAQAAAITNSQAKAVIDAALEGIKSGLKKKGERILLADFGTFTIAEPKARVGRNPKTGETIKIPRRLVPKFSAGKALKESLK